MGHLPIATVTRSPIVLVGHIDDRVDISKSSEERRVRVDGRRVDRRNVLNGVSIEGVRKVEVTVNSDFDSVYDVY